MRFLHIADLHLGKSLDDFDLKEFHRRILDIGPVQFPVLEKYMK